MAVGRFLASLATIGRARGRHREMTPMQRYRIVSALVAGALVIGLGACGGSDKNAGKSAAPATTNPPASAPTTTGLPTPAGPTFYKNGQSAVVATTEDDGTFGRVKITAKIRDIGNVVPDRDGVTGGPQYAKNGRFAVATISYVGLIGTYRASDAFWSIRMADGQVYNPYDSPVIATSNLRLGQDLPQVRVHQGQRVKGIVALDVPKGHGVLVLDTNAEPDVAEWRF